MFVVSYILGCHKIKTPPPISWPTRLKCLRHKWHIYSASVSFNTYKVVLFCFWFKTKLSILVLTSFFSSETFGLVLRLFCFFIYKTPFNSSSNSLFFPMKTLVWSWNLFFKFVKPSVSLIFIKNLKPKLV